MTLSAKDLTYIQDRGSDPDQVKRQLHNFETGFPFVSVEEPAQIGKGISKLTEAEVEALSRTWESRLGKKTVLKFVPASGAASRMFKALFSFVKSTGPVLAGDVQQAWEHISHFAFFDELISQVPAHDKGDPRKVFQYLLEETGLGYGQKPKGLLAFHQYPEGSRTPFEEHLVEGVQYARAEDGKARLHFTVSPEHRPGFEHLFTKVYTAYQDKFQTDFEVTFSEQKPSTDTIAVDMENQPFRLEDGTILFRPGGHGALIENLNELEADIIFVKNIDNVVPDSLREDTVTYKRALASHLLSVQQNIFDLISAIDKNPDTATQKRCLDFIQKTLFVTPPSSIATWTTHETITWIRTRLDRPLRVCGMVKNEGEPGGGPFLVHMADGTVSPQIVESAQLDSNDETIMQKVAAATHFNPVDLICATRNSAGEKYDLRKFVDPQAGFITEKSLEGRALKAQELPGLWNGAMAHWNTIFVEVPITTFSPVKTVNDLLRPQHQA